MSFIYASGARDLRALAVTLTTTRVGTFNPAMTKTGASPVWTDDQGNAYTGLTPSFSYASAGTKTITVTSPDGWAGLTVFRANALNLTSISPNFVTLWQSATTFECHTNAALTFDIAALANWRPTDFRCFNNAVSGDIAALANWRPTDFRCFNNAVSGDIAALANWRPTLFSCINNTVSGDIAALANWRPTIFSCYSNAVTCSGAGGGQMYAAANMTLYRVDATQIDTTGINAIVVDLWDNRVVSNTRTINISSVPGVLSADSVARIEGTGAYAGDGIKRAGVTVTYTAP